MDSKNKMFVIEWRQRVIHVKKKIERGGDVVPTK